MPRVSIEHLQKLQEQQDNIRNISVIAHVDHGKSTLTDSLLVAAGIQKSSNIGGRKTDTLKMEADRCITIKSTGVSLVGEYDWGMRGGDGGEGEAGSSNLLAAVRKNGGQLQGKQEHLVNLIDSPGHVDFSSEVTAALRLSDGALVVVDCVEGVSVQTETVLRQALGERVKPVLCLNKLDRLFSEVQDDPEDMYRRFVKIVTEVNVYISMFQEKLGDDAMHGRWLVDPSLGNVAFAAGLHGWGFTLETFADMYAKLYDTPRERMLKRLWGDHFYNVEKKTWSTTPSKGSVRGFCHLIVKPIQAMLKLCQAGKNDRVNQRMKALGFGPTDVDLDKKQFMLKVMQTWLPAAKPLLDMIIVHLPSPRKAQAYRAECLIEYDIPDTDNETDPENALKEKRDLQVCESVERCDPNGPLLVYISKLIPEGGEKSNSSRFMAFGRVFSGTIKSGMKINVRSKGAWRSVNVQRVSIMMAGSFETVAAVPSGNTVAVFGVDSSIVKTATLTDIKRSCCYIKEMTYTVSPVVRVAVLPEKAVDLPKLVEALQKLSQSDSTLLYITEDSGEHILAACGELHLEVSLEILRTQFLRGDVRIKTTPPVVSYCESVVAESTQSSMCKSTDKLNRITMVAAPTDPEVKAKAMVTIDSNTKQEQVEKLLRECGWSALDARKVWFLDEQGNMLVNRTVGVQGLNDVKGSIKSAFQWVTRQGLLAEEPLQGVTFELLDARVHPDPAHHGGDQIIPAARRAMLAAMRIAEPIMLEPYFLVEVTAPFEVISSVYNVITQRRGVMQSEEGLALRTVRAFLPVAESFGVDAALRGKSGGKAFLTMQFSHFEACPGDPFTAGSLQEGVVSSVRKRKKLKEGVPAYDALADKL